MSGIKWVDICVDGEVVERNVPYNKRCEVANKYRSKGTVTMSGCTYRRDAEKQKEKQSGAKMDGEGS